MDLERLAYSFDITATLTEGLSLKPFYQQVKNDLAATVESNFAGQHDPDGNPWPEPKQPLHPLQKMLVTSKNRQLLIESGALYLSATESIIQAPLADDGFLVDPAWVNYGSFHAEGAPPRLPQREFSGWGEEFLDETVENLVEFTTEKLLSSGVFTLP